MAIARAIVRSPKLFLLDEPLANIDAALRQELRGVMLDLQQRGAVTFDYGTTTSYGTTVAATSGGTVPAGSGSTG